MAVDRFVRELDEVREQLGLGRVHLLGQSWGGCLALQYALDHPEGVASLILSDTSASIAHAVNGMIGLRLAFGPEFVSTMLRYEALGDLENPQYKACVDELYIRHLWRVFPWEHDRALGDYRANVEPLFGEQGPAYAAMWGPHEFHCTGSLGSWDVTDRLGEISAPALILCGYYDEVPIACHQILACRLPDNEFVIFGNSSHLPFLEGDANSYLAVVRDFVRRHSSEAVG